MQAAQYPFPFADSSFDFVYLVSVFTHMLPADMEHYLSEISRVLKPAAKCAVSFFG
jgi:ubiquinone/menaquinone biosynthesis C-methylase UbiE